MEKIIGIEEAQKLRREKRSAAVTKKKVQEANENALKATQVPEKKKSKLFLLSKRVAIFAVATFAIVFVLLSAVQLINLSMAAHEAETVLAEKEAEKALIEKQLTLIDDPAFIESQVREHLRMIRPGETLYVFSEPEKETDK